MKMRPGFLYLVIQVVREAQQCFLRLPIALARSQEASGPQVVDTYSSSLIICFQVFQDSTQPPAGLCSPFQEHPRAFLPWVSAPGLHGDFCLKPQSVILGAALGIFFVLFRVCFCLWSLEKPVWLFLLLRSPPFWFLSFTCRPPLQQTAFALVHLFHP